LRLAPSARQLFDCCDNAETCCYGAWCTPCQIGDWAEEAKAGDCCATGIVWFGLTQLNQARGLSP